MLSIYAAFFLDFLFGDPYWFPHPVRLIGNYIIGFEKSIRKFIKSRAGLKAAGVILTLTTVFISYFSFYYILIFAKGINNYLYVVLNIVLMYFCIAPKCLSKEGMNIYNYLKKDDIKGAREQLSYIVGRDTNNLNESEIVRATVETVAENTSDGVIAPLFYMFIGGAPLAFAYKAINTLDSMVGYKNDKYMDFGYFSAKLDDLVNLVPARISAIMLIFSSLFLGLDYKKSLYILKRDRKNHSSPNSGYPEAAVAGALGVRLGGANSYFGKIVEKPYIGDANRCLYRDDIIKTNKMMYVSSILFIVLCSICINVMRSF